MRVLGIDHGTRTAYSCIEDGKCIETGTIKFKGNLINYLKEIEDVIKRLKPNYVALEEPKCIRNAKVTNFLTTLYTICKLACDDLVTCYIECNVKSVKKYITGNGNSGKLDVYDNLLKNFNVNQKFIYKIEHYKTNKDKVKNQFFDESDATALALFVYNDKINM
ncbi:MAG: crossover junction endodeoxyribonuclease RuvC [Clostridium sp.]